MISRNQFSQNLNYLIKRDKKKKKAKKKSQREAVEDKTDSEFMIIPPIDTEKFEEKVRLEMAYDNKFDGMTKPDNEKMQQLLEQYCNKQVKEIEGALMSGVEALERISSKCEVQFQEDFLLVHVATNTFLSVDPVPFPYTQKTGYQSQEETIKKSMKVAGANDIAYMLFKVSLLPAPSRNSKFKFIHHDEKNQTGSVKTGIYHKLVAYNPGSRFMEISILGLNNKVYFSDLDQSEVMLKFSQNTREKKVEERLCIFPIKIYCPRTGLYLESIECKTGDSAEEVEETKEDKIISSSITNTSSHCIRFVDDVNEGDLGLWWKICCFQKKNKFCLQNLLTGKIVGMGLNKNLAFVKQSEKNNNISIELKPHGDVQAKIFQIIFSSVGEYYTLWNEVPATTHENRSHRIEIEASLKKCEFEEAFRIFKGPKELMNDIRFCKDLISTLKSIQQKPMKSRLITLKKALLALINFVQNRERGHMIVNVEYNTTDTQKQIILIKMNVIEHLAKVLILLSAELELDRNSSESFNSTIPNLISLVLESVEEISRNNVLAQQEALTSFYEIPIIITKRFNNAISKMYSVIIQGIPITKINPSIIDKVEKIRDRTLEKLTTFSFTIEDLKLLQTILLLKYSSPEKVAFHFYEKMKFNPIFNSIIDDSFVSVTETIEAIKKQMWEKCENFNELIIEIFGVISQIYVNLERAEPICSPKKLLKTINDPDSVISLCSISLYSSIRNKQIKIYPVNKLQQVYSISNVHALTESKPIKEEIKLDVVEKDLNEFIGIVFNLKPDLENDPSLPEKYYHCLRLLNSLLLRELIKKEDLKMLMLGENKNIPGIVLIGERIREIHEKGQISGHILSKLKWSKFNQTHNSKTRDALIFDKKEELLSLYHELIIQVMFEYKKALIDLKHSREFSWEYLMTSEFAILINRLYNEIQEQQVKVFINEYLAQPDSGIKNPEEIESLQAKLALKFTEENLMPDFADEEILNYWSISPDRDQAKKDLHKYFAELMILSHCMNGPLTRTSIRLLHAYDECIAQFCLKLENVSLYYENSNVDVVCNKLSEVLEAARKIDLLTISRSEEYQEKFKVYCEDLAKIVLELKESGVVLKKVMQNKRFHEQILKYINTHQEALIKTRKNPSALWCSYYNKFYNLLFKILRVFCKNYDKNKIPLWENYDKILMPKLKYSPRQKEIKLYEELVRNTRKIQYSSAMDDFLSTLSECVISDKDKLLNFYIIMFEYRNVYPSIRKKVSEIIIRKVNSNFMNEVNFNINRRPPRKCKEYSNLFAVMTELIKEGNISEEKIKENVKGNLNINESALKLEEKEKLEVLQENYNGLCELLFPKERNISKIVQSKIIEESPDKFEVSSKRDRNSEVKDPPLPIASSRPLLESQRNEEAKCKDQYWDYYSKTVTCAKHTIKLQHQEKQLGYIALAKACQNEQTANLYQFFLYSVYLRTFDEETNDDSDTCIMLGVQIFQFGNFLKSVVKGSRKEQLELAKQFPTVELVKILTETQTMTGLRKTIFMPLILWSITQLFMIQTDNIDKTFNDIFSESQERFIKLLMMINKILENKLRKMRLKHNKKENKKLTSKKFKKREKKLIDKEIDNEKNRNREKEKLSGIQSTTMRLLQFLRNIFDGIPTLAKLISETPGGREKLNSTCATLVSLLHYAIEETKNKTHVSVKFSDKDSWIINGTLETIGHIFAQSMIHEKAAIKENSFANAFYKTSLLDELLEILKISPDKNSIVKMKGLDYIIMKSKITTLEIFSVIMDDPSKSIKERVLAVLRTLPEDCLTNNFEYFYETSKSKGLQHSYLTDTLDCHFYHSYDNPYRLYLNLAYFNYLLMYKVRRNLNSALTPPCMKRFIRVQENLLIPKLKDTPTEGNNLGTIFRNYFKSQSEDSSLEEICKFFKLYVGEVVVIENQDGQEKSRNTLYFPIRPESTFWRERHVKEFMSNVPIAPAVTRMKNFIENYLWLSSMFQGAYRTYRWTNYYVLSDIVRLKTLWVFTSTVIVLFLNLALFSKYSTDSQKNKDLSEFLAAISDSTDPIFTPISVLLLILSLMLLLPMLLEQILQTHYLRKDIKTRDASSSTTIVKAIREKLISNTVQTSSLNINSEAIYFVIFSLCIILAIGLDRRIIAFHLSIIIVFSRIIKNLLQVFSSILLKIVMNLVVAIIIIYWFTVLAYTYYKNLYSNDSCSTLFKCFFVTFDHTFKHDGGVGSYTDRIAPAYSSSANIDYGKLLYDNFFNLIVLMIIIQIFSSLIINQFGVNEELTDKRREMIMNQCYICGIRKAFLYQGNKYQKHLTQTHNLWIYLHFMFFATHTNSINLDLAARVTKQQILNMDTSWIPFSNSSTE